MQRDGDPLVRLRGGAQAVSSAPMPAWKWKTRVLAPGLVLAAAAGLLVVSSWGVLVPARDVRVLPVVVKRVAGVSARAGTPVAQAAGWIEPDPYPYYATALADGIVEEVLVLEGERVTKGQVVGRLVRADAELELARMEAEVLAAEAAVGEAEAEFAAAEETLESLVELRAALAAAEAGVAEAAARVGQARAEVLVEEAELAVLEDERARKRTLAESNAVSRGELAQLELMYTAQERMVENARAMIVVEQSAELAARAEGERAGRTLELTIAEREAVKRAASRVELMKADAAAARAARDEAALRVSRMDVLSPVDGVVMTRLAAPGSKLMLVMDDPDSSHIVHIYQPEHLQVRVDVPLADASLVGVGQRAEVIVEALPDRTFAGAVTRLVHEADIQKNTVQVKVAIEDPDPLLKPEMVARVRFLSSGDVGEGGGGEAAMSDAGQRVFAAGVGLVREGEGDSASALVVGHREGSRGRVEARRVTLGRAEVDGWVEVVSGLLPGDLVIATDAGIGAGARVRVVGEAEDRGTGG